MLNRWAADKLDAKPGDEIRLVFFDPESTHGIARERTATLRLKAVTPIEGPADDRNLTPELKGVTDKLSMAAWNPPFPFDDRRVGKDDEDYWKKYGATPKAFVSLATARKLWASRFGDTTLDSHCPCAGHHRRKAASRLAPGSRRPWGSSSGRCGNSRLAAASGTTPFNGLFIGLQFLSDCFGRDAGGDAVSAGHRCTGRRNRHLAGRWVCPPARCAACCWPKGLALAAIAGLLGAAAGIGYAWLMIVGLRTWWLPAIGTPFLELYVGGVSLRHRLCAGRAGVAGGHRLERGPHAAAFRFGGCWPGRSELFAGRDAAGGGSSAARRIAAGLPGGRRLIWFAARSVGNGAGGGFFRRGWLWL